MRQSSHTLIELLVTSINSENIGQVELPFPESFGRKAVRSFRNLR